MVSPVCYYRSGQLRLAYSRAGSGSVVVFLHGVGGNRSNWERQVQHFSSGYCAIAWDARGYGASDDPPGGRLAFSDFADDLAALLDHLLVRKAHLVGLSMGGMICQDFWSRYPQRVASMVLAGTSSGFGGLTRQERAEFLARRLAPLDAGRTPADIAPDVVKVLAGPHADAVVREELRLSMSALRTASYRAALNAIVETDFRSILGSIAVPVLVVVGSEDRVLPEQESRKLAAAVPGAGLTVLPGIGHLSNIEAPAEFNRIVGEFLAKCGASE